eukprot:TRINITY_DN12738_c0_g1_i2.p1 TRINITY_DN12738_c0_g1~~TRINITY_DN12738_c0_g1_i2.p1  ORF type:complete len:483 (-),score=107.29 TRINITY_DN12738_c0_g1_i2:24-1472(-)
MTHIVQKRSLHDASYLSLSPTKKGKELPLPTRVDPSSFYAVRHEQTSTFIHQSMPEEIAKEIREKSIFEIFPNLQPAIEFKKSHDDLDLSIFAFDVSFDGRKNFLVTSIERFYKHYTSLRPFERVYNEVIEEESRVHLYLDIEFSRADNPIKDGESIITVLMHQLTAFAFSTIGLSIKSQNVVDLESPSDTKFSRHLIIKFPGYAFESNRTAGHFIYSFASHLESQSHTISEIQELYVMDGEKRRLPLDLGVYSRNQLFRIINSTKKGKNSYLVPSPRSHQIQSPKKLFLESLVTCYDPLVKIIQVPHCKKPESYTKAKSSPQILMTHQDDVYAQIEKFVLLLVQQEGMNGSIASSRIFTDTQTIVFQIGKGYRWCGNVMRQHRSNSVMMIVSLQQAHVYQKCHDPDCKEYRSEPIPLPETISLLLHNLQIQTKDNQDAADESFPHSLQYPPSDGDGYLNQEESQLLDELESIYSLVQSGDL